MISSPPLIRFAHPMAFQRYLHHAGAPVDAFLRRNGLPALCEDPDVFVPVTRVWAFFDEESRAENLLLGWQVGEFVGDHSINAGLLRKIENATTLYAAMQQLVNLVRTEGTDVDIGIYERREDVLFYSHYWEGSEIPGYHVSQGYQLGVLLDLVRFFLGRNWVPCEIGLEADRILGELKERFPNCRIRLRQPFGFIAIPRKYLHCGARNASSISVEELKRAGKGYLTYVETVREVVRAYISEGYVSEETAAGLMDTSVRTLTRRLAYHGITYGNLVDDVRFGMAKEQLGMKDRRVIDVAQSTGFSDQANFTRMFRRISGITPSQFRRLLGNGHSELGPP